MRISEGALAEIELQWERLRKGVYVPWELKQLVQDDTRAPAELMSQTITGWLVRNIAGGGSLTSEHLKEILGDRLRYCSLSVQYDPQGRFGTLFQVTEIHNGISQPAPDPMKDLLTFATFRATIESHYPIELDAARCFGQWATKLADEAHRIDCKGVAKGFQRMASEIRRNNFPATLLKDGFNLYQMAYPTHLTLEDLLWVLQ